MKALKYITILCTALTLSACLEPTPQTTKPTDAQALVNSFVYVKAKNNLCFGISTTQRMDTGFKVSETVQVVNVPCKDVGL